MASGAPSKYSLLTNFLAISLVAGAQYVGGSPFFQGISYGPGAGIESHAYAVSADGYVAVGSCLTVDGWQAFRWTAQTGMVTLGHLPGMWPFRIGATGVSADGSVVVGFVCSERMSEQVVEAFRWTAETGMQMLGDLSGGEFNSVASAVSADGSVVVGRGSSAQSFEAFRWTQTAGMTSIQGAGWWASEAFGVSADGLVVVGMGVHATLDKAFRWTAATGMVDLGFLPGGSIYSVATAASQDGSVVVGSSHYPPGPLLEGAFRWTASEGMVPLGGQPGGLFAMYASAVSWDGAVIVGEGLRNPPGPYEPYVWTATTGTLPLYNVFIDVGLGTQVNGWTLLNVTGVSADGKVFAGYGINPGGQVEAWVASIRLDNHLIPEPASGVLLIAGLVVLVRRRRRTAQPLCG